MQLTDLAFPEAWREKTARVAEALDAHDDYLVCAHARLDGDALSSMAAMGTFLAKRGKRFCLYAPFGVPDHLDFLRLPGKMHTSLEALPFRPKVIVALDCGTPGRLGDELEAVFGEYACINVDHHVGGGMGTLATAVLPESASTTQALANVFFAANAEFDETLSRLLMLGLVTDTGGFRHANTSPRVLALAAFLEAHGASIHRLRESLEKTWSLQRMQLWGRMSAEMQLLFDGRVALCPLSLDTLQSCGATSEDTEGYVEHMRELKSVQVACFVREQSPGTCKFSLRSVEDVDVNVVAASFGGGGHKNAAGGTLAMPLDKALDTLERRLSQLFANEQAALTRGAPSS